MKYFKKLLPYLISASLLTPCFAQEEDDEATSDAGGEPAGESVAEASVTGSASQPATESSGSIESNPVVTLVRSGLSITKAVKLSPAKIAKIAKSSGSITNFSSTAKKVEQGTIDVDKLVKALDSGSYFNALTSYSDLVSLADKTASALGGSNTYLEQAVSLADTFITDVTLTKASELPTDVTVASLGSSVTYEMLQLLNNYGAFGSSGDSIVAAAGVASGSSLSAKSSTSDYITYLNTIIGKSTLDKNLKDKNGNPISVTRVPTDEIKVAGANKYTLGASSVLSTIDVSEKLKPVTTSGPDEAPADERIYIIGAIKDVFTAGAVKFDNTNDAEDHVLAIGAGDQVGIYHDITYTGSNLAIGQAGKIASDDATYSTRTSAINDKRALLIQADISTGGNLAIGSLGQIQVKGSTFTLGTANADSSAPTGYTSDPDNLYIYANDLIEINGLTFGSPDRLDDVYMEAITINLKDVTFPSASDVMLRTRDGTIAFDRFSNPKIGSANFENVVHLGIRSTKLVESDFSYVNDQYQTSHNAVIVRKL